jgi:hypothetical protein
MKPVSEFNRRWQVTDCTALSVSPHSAAQRLLWAFFKNAVSACNAYYHSAQSLSSSRLLSENIRIRIYKTIILPVVLYGCETWFLTLREEHRLRVLRRIFGPKRNEVMGDWRKTA